MWPGYGSTAGVGYEERAGGGMFSSALVQVFPPPSSKRAMDGHVRTSFSSEGFPAVDSWDPDDLVICATGA